MRKFQAPLGLLSSLILALINLLVNVFVFASDEASTTLIHSVCGRVRATNPQPFDVNFVGAMEIISKNISSTGFVMSVFGADASDRVYGLGQCLNYLSKTDCGLCYAEGRVKLPLCLPSNSARVYLMGCFLRYGNYNFSEEAKDRWDSSVCGSVSKDVKKNEAKFREVAGALIGNLTYRAHEESDYYKEGNASVSSSGVRVYGAAQCWRSLSKSGCRECLLSARDRIMGCLPGSDGKALSAGCFVRYSQEPFYLMPLSNHSSSAKRRRLAASFGVIFACLIVICAAITFWRKNKRSRNAANSFTNREGSSEIFRLISKSRLSFKYEELRNATNHFSLENKLGQGGYGTVYKGILPDGREIAVKRLFVHTTQFVEQFFNEVNLISQVQHKNLVKLLGCSVEGPESLLVYEYLCNNSLEHFRKVVLDWERRLNILIGTAEGLAYLHEAAGIRIIHRDIKASNILLDENFKPKIADFGLARYFAEGQSHLSTGIAGTIGYMAPEYVIHGQLTEKADVYSYGVLVHEVVTGLRNPSSISGSYETLVSQVWDHFTSDTVIEMLDPNLRGQCPEEQVLKVLHVGLLCTQASPDLRPTMRNVVEMLNRKTNDLPLPAEPPFLDLKGMELKFGFDSSATFSRTLSSSKPSSSRHPVSINQVSLSITQGR